MFDAERRRDRRALPAHRRTAGGRRRPARAAPARRPAASARSSSSNARPTCPRRHRRCGARRRRAAFRRRRVTPTQPGSPSRQVRPPGRAPGSRDRRTRPRRSTSSSRARAHRPEPTTSGGARARRARRHARANQGRHRPRSVGCVDEAQFVLRQRAGLVEAHHVASRASVSNASRPLHEHAAPRHPAGRAESMAAGVASASAQGRSRSAPDRDPHRARRIDHAPDDGRDCGERQDRPQERRCEPIGGPAGIAGRSVSARCTRSTICW